MILPILLLLLALPLFQKKKPELNTNDGTNTNATQSAEIFYEELYPYYRPIWKLIPDDGRVTYTVPGTIQTTTLVAIGEKKGELDTAEDMTPQGLAMTEDYVLISAYSKSKTYNSVIWVLERTSGDYIKTIVLPNRSHVGGLAYDPHHHLIWITTTDKENDAQISAFNLDKLNSYDFTESEEAIDLDYIINLDDIWRSSYLTYHENKLFVGYFDKDILGHLGVFSLDKNGLPLKNGSSDNRYAPEKIIDTPEQVQGLTFYQDKLIFSQSYGSKDSKLLYFTNPGLDKWESLEENINLDKSLTTPAYMQQIITQDDHLFLLFESSAVQYRDKPTISPMDRVIKIKAE